MPEHDVSLTTLIRAVSEQLLASRAERLAESRAALFEISELTVEVSFVVTESSAAGGGFDLKVVKADASRKYDEQAVQRISLKLKALGDGGGGDVLTELGDELPLRPRADGLER